MFTRIFPTQKYQGFRPDQVCFHMSRHVHPTYGTLSTMTSRHDGVDATVNVVNGVNGVNWLLVLACVTSMGLYLFCFVCLYLTTHKIVSQSPRKHASVPPDKRHCRQWMSSLFCGFLPNPLSITYSVDVPVTNL